MSRDHETAPGDRSVPDSTAARCLVDHIGQPFMLAVVAVGAAGYLMRLAHLPYAWEVNALGCILMMIALLVLAIGKAMQLLGWLPKDAAPEPGAPSALRETPRREPTEILECAYSPDALPGFARARSPPAPFRGDDEGGAQLAFHGGEFSISVGGRPRIATWTTDIHN